MPAAEYNQALLRVGSKRLLENPAGYARLAMDEYLSLWLIFSRRHPAIAADFDAYVAKARPVPLEAYLDVESLQPTDPSRVALVARPAFIVVGLLLFLVTIGFGCAVVVRRRTSPLLLFAWLSALCVEAMAVFIALTGTGEGRYTMGMWPYIVMALLMAAMAVYTAAFESRRRRTGKAVGEPAT